MILLYIGPGKGKTSACVGQCLRAHGQGFVVAFGQFMKRDHLAGEQDVLRGLLGKRFLAGGIGFFREEEKRPAQRAAAQKVLQWAHGQIAAGAQMLVLDEACNALGRDLLLEDEMRGLCQACRKADCHLVLSGRTAPPWLQDEADLVTRMDAVKHPYTQGVPAQKGIEF